MRGSAIILFNIFVLRTFLFLTYWLIGSPSHTSFKFSFRLACSSFRNSLSTIFCYLDILSTMSAKDNSSTSKACSFCNSKEDNEVEYGKIYEYNGIVTHYYCLVGIQVILSISGCWSPISSSSLYCWTCSLKDVQDNIRNTRMPLKLLPFVSFYLFI